MKYFVGQILYVVLAKKNQVYPMQVVEMITKQTLRGEEKQYILQGGPDVTSKVELSKLDGEIFESAAEVLETLTSRANRQIQKIVENAVSKSEEWYGISKKQEAHPENLEALSESDFSAVILPDGTKAKVKFSNGISTEVENH